MRWLLLALIGCADPRPVEYGAPPTAPLTIRDLWLGANPAGVITLEAITISPVTAGDAGFYVQQEGGGPASGMYVQLGDGTADRVPEVGTPIRIRGEWTRFGEPPVLMVSDEDDIQIRGEPIVPAATRFRADDRLVFSLVKAQGVQITSPVDPAGLAWTSLGARIRPDFGIPAPGYGRTGELVGIRGQASAILLRSEDDWSGDWESDPPLTMDIAAIPGLPDGFYVTVHDLTLVTAGDRYAVLQDADGNGLWLDAEGFGLPDLAIGDVASWTGEVSHSSDGPVLRVWEPPVVTAFRDPVLYAGDPAVAPDGTWLVTAVTGLGETGPRGDRGADGWLLDNRFTDVTTLTNGTVVEGVVRVDRNEIRRLAVLP